MDRKSRYRPPEALAALLAPEALAGACAEREAVERDAVRARRAANLAAVGANITDEDRAAIIAGRCKVTHALRSVRRWHASDRGADGRPLRFLALLGPKGYGKTVALAWRIAEAGGVFVTARELYAWARSFADAAKWEHARRARFLVIDDVGTEDMRELAELHSVYWDLITQRQGLGYQTGMSSGLSAPCLAERLGERAWDRMQHQGGIVECAGADMRRKVVL